MAKQRFTIDLSGQGGLSTDYFGNKYLGTSVQFAFGDEQSRYLAEDTQFVAGVFNPNIRPGYASPSITTVTPVTTTGSYDALMSCSLFDDINDDVYMFEADTTIHKGDTAIDTTWTEDKTIANAKYTDACIYELNGVRTMYFIYQNSTTDTFIGTKNLTSGVYTDINLGAAGTITNNFTPVFSFGKLIPAGDGFLYVLNKNFVHRIDGTVLGGANGTVYQSILTAPTYFNFSHGLDFRNNLYLVIQRNNLYQSLTSSSQSSNSNTECGVYIWNRQNTFFNTSDYIQLKGVREIRSIHISPKNTVRIFCISSNGTPQLREFNGNYFVVIREFDSGAFPMVEDAVVVNGNFTTWLGINGRMYTYGTDRPGAKEALSIILQLPSVQNTGSIVYCDNASHGAVGNATEGVSNQSPEGIFIYYNDGTRRIAKAYPNSPYSVDSTTPTKSIGDIFTPVKFLPALSTVHHVNIFMLPRPVTGTTTSATLKFYFNQSGTASITKTVNYNDLAKGYLSIELNKPYINSIQMEIEHDVAISFGTADFCPSYCEVIYEPTNTLK